MIKKENALFLNDDIGTVEITNPHTDKSCWVVFGIPDLSISSGREFEIIGIGDSQELAIQDALIRCFDFRKNSAHVDNIKEYLSGIFNSDKYEDRVYLGCYPDNHKNKNVLSSYKKDGKKYGLNICQTDNEENKDKYGLLFS